MKLDNGLVHVYTGDGKGKSTAALGIAFRALGWGLKVCIVQFIKGYSEIGEIKVADIFPEQYTIKQFNIDIARWIDEKKVCNRLKAAEAAMEYAELAISSGKYDIIILDEINNAMHYNLVDIQRVLCMIRNKPKNLELILTGRNAPQAIIDAADYVTEMQMIKHPYERCIKARAGIDY